MKFTPTMDGNMRWTSAQVDLKSSGHAGPLTLAVHLHPDKKRYAT